MGISAKTSLLFAVGALCTALLLALFPGLASAMGQPTPTPLPPSQPNPTSFEDIIPNSAIGEIIVVGVSPESARLGGNAFAGQIGLGGLYHTGVRSWMVRPNGTGVIEFPGTEAAVVEFWARVILAANDVTVITAFDDLGVAIGDDVTISPGTGWQFVSLSATVDQSIASIDVVNFDADQMNGIDDFGFTVPEPGALLSLGSGMMLLGWLDCRRRRRASGH